MAPAPEFTLLTDAVAGVRPGHADVGSWDAARWDAALHAAEWHRLSPLLHRWCAELPGVPRGVRARLEEAYLANAARNLQVLTTLRDVLAALHDAGVPAMPLKGAALLGTAYPDPALRELLDLDVLVPLPALGDARRALLAAGFAPGEDQADLEAHTMGSNDHHDDVLVAAHRVVAVELHHHVAMPAEREHFDIGGVWARAQHAAGPPPHLLPSHEDLLVHLCVHFMRNRLGGGYRRAGTGGALAQLYDVGAVLARLPVDWDRLAALARAYGLASRVHLALFAAREVGVAVPADGLALLEPEDFDAALGRRLVALRVLRAGPQLPVRTLRFIVAPGRDVLERGWDAGDGRGVALTRAYLRRAMAKAPLATAALRRPRAVLDDYRLNAQIRALEAGEHDRLPPLSTTPVTKA